MQITPGDSRAVLPRARLPTHSDQSAPRVLGHGIQLGLLLPILVSRSHGIAEFPSDQQGNRTGKRLYNIGISDLYD